MGRWNSDREEQVTSAIMVPVHADYKYDAYGKYIHSIALRRSIPGQTANRKYLVKYAASSIERDYHSTSPAEIFPRIPAKQHLNLRAKIANAFPMSPFPVP